MVKVCEVVVRDVLVLVLKWCVEVAAAAVVGDTEIRMCSWVGFELVLRGRL